jgi:hypothetical protein
MKQSILFEKGKLYVVELPDKEDLKYYPVIVPTNNPSKLKHRFNEELYKNDTDEAIANKVEVNNPEVISIYADGEQRPFAWIKVNMDNNTYFPLPADLTFNKETGMLKRIEPEKPEETQDALIHSPITLFEEMDDSGCSRDTKLIKVKNRFTIQRKKS